MSIEFKSEAAEPVLARKLSARWKKKGILSYAKQRIEGIVLNSQPPTR
jgi:hypothetical protein